MDGNVLRCVRQLLQLNKDNKVAMSIKVKSIKAKSIKVIKSTKCIKFKWK